MPKLKILLNIPLPESLYQWMNWMPCSDLLKRPLASQSPFLVHLDSENTNGKLVLAVHYKIKRNQVLTDL